jgi:hypothetical protein
VEAYRAVVTTASSATRTNAIKTIRPIDWATALLTLV